ncbi:hypothetical protein BSA16_14625 [Micromonospora sp. Rc5]|nr:hypothetical protein BSA16_14625 [Micromonospora sp. Rc5]
MTCTTSQSERTTARSWLIISSAAPVVARICRSRASTSAWTETSRPEVGSSATMSRGRMSSARAMQTRWAWPPESWCG